MRLVALYARSRQVPTALGIVVLAAVLVAWWAQRGGADDVRQSVVLATAGAAVLATGLSGSDTAIERTAAIRWWLWRTGHVATIAVVGVVTTPAAVGFSVPFGTVARNAVGLAGLAALGAAVLGAHLAWSLPLGWLTAAAFALPAPGTGAAVVSWLLRPLDSPAAMVTALVLGVVGTVSYAALGPRR